MSLLISCNKKQEINRAFYYWKSNEECLQDKEKEILKSQNITKLYIKFFEVVPEWSERAVPQSKTSFRSFNDCNKLLDTLNIEYIPTIFIKNNVFKPHYDDSVDIDKLADNIVYLIEKHNFQKFNNKSFKEIQIDCDWTPSTKIAYFKLLKEIKFKSKKQISATLRLYPYKYDDIMGVPPVDRVSLMCYNLIEPLADKNKNSILENSELKKYLTRKSEYPIPMDIALPIYSWLLVYRGNEFSHLESNGIQSILYICNPLKPMWYEVQKDTTINNEYYRIGDKIKFEEINYEKLKTTIQLIRQQIKLKNQYTISLFHLDYEQLNSYKNEEVNRLYTDFSY